MNYPEIAFSDTTKRFQERYGSRAAYARMEKNSFTDGLTENEIEYIAEQDHFYMATMGENGFPYIQFRGGPKGFLKAISQKQLGFLDFRGNRQYVSIGNLTTNNKVSLILLDQAAKARLKIYAEAEIREISQNQELYDLLNLKDYTFRAERIIMLNVKAYDWNCPQHITPRYTLEEIQEEFSAQNEYIHKLREEIRALKEKLAQ
jgi:predicted pyridoxine 5'-phosphate oxidase superfamily flavin-nucleotide-binding protein